jgi:hypothetical protein
MAIFASVFYTSFTVTGSLLVHYYSLKNEKGRVCCWRYLEVRADPRGAVGAHTETCQPHWSRTSLNKAKPLLARFKVLM